jgi:hypothetical protein
VSDTAVTIALEADEAAALDRYRRDLGPSATRSDALSAILREWISQSSTSPADPNNAIDAIDEGLRPSELNSSNDI